MAPTCRVAGGSPQMRTAVRLAVEQALRGLEWDTELLVTIEARPGDADHEASANDDEIWLQPRLVKKGGPRLEWVATEEVAHCYLAERAGVPHGGTFIEVLLQELFATWVQYRQHVLNGHLLASQLDTWPVPEFPPAEPTDLEPRLGSHLGKHIAAAALGNAPNQEHLEEWVQRPTTDPRLAELVEGFGSALPWSGTAVAMADALGEFHELLSEPLRGEG